jgi:nucleoredoxin
LPEWSSFAQVIMFYFSAHWCGPCKAFTPLLRRWYQRHSEDKQLEVVFVSNDRDENEFKNYFSTM